MTIHVNDPREGQQGEGSRRSVRSRLSGSLYWDLPAKSLQFSLVWPNNPATGAPTISGTAQVVETLTADTSGIVDADGLTNASFSYQWLADNADIAGFRPQSGTEPPPVNEAAAGQGAETQRGPHTWTSRGRHRINTMATPVSWRPRSLSEDSFLETKPATQ